MSSSEMRQQMPNGVAVLAILGCLLTGLVGLMPCILHGNTGGMLASFLSFGILVHYSFR